MLEAQDYLGQEASSMPMERWGTLSVKDHLNSQAMIADILLYDRLVFPVLSGEGERTRWREAEWDPERQEQLIEDLGAEITVTAAWDAQRRQYFDDLRKARARQQIAQETAFQTTRILLAMDMAFVPAGTEVRMVAAYHDEAEGRKDLGLATAQPDEIALGKLAFVVSQQLLVPFIDPKAPASDLMRRARDLSLAAHYRNQRQQFYRWQEETVDAIVRGRQTANHAVDDLTKQVEALNHTVRNHFSERWGPLTMKAVLTVVGISLPFVLEGHAAAGLLGLIPPAFELVKFGAEEGIEAMTGRKCEAAAMLVSARKAVG